MATSETALLAELDCVESLDTLEEFCNHLADAAPLRLNGEFSELLMQKAFQLGMSLDFASGYLALFSQGQPVFSNQERH